MLVKKFKFWIRILIDFSDVVEYDTKGKLESKNMKRKNDLISASQRFYKRMMDSQTNSRPMSARSDRHSVSSEGLLYNPEENRVPIHEASNSRMQHLAAKAKEWYDASVLEGLYMSTLIYLRESDNWGYGAKLSGYEFVRSECGPVIGTKECAAEGIIWKNVDVREWYRALKGRIF